MNVQLVTLQAKNTAPLKREVIFRSTLKLINEFGFHGTPISRIAQEAGVAAGTIYHYFASKDELIIALFRHAKQLTHHATFSNIDKNLSYKEQFFKIGVNLYHYYTKYPEVLGFFEQFYSSPFVKMVYIEETLCLQDEIAHFLADGVQDEHIKSLDINILGAVFIGTIVVASKRHNNRLFTFDPDQLHQMMETIWDGIKR